MGFFRAPAFKQAITKGLSAEELRVQEEAKIRQEGRQALVSAESRRSQLRKRLAGDEDQDQVQRKRLFGE